MNRAIEILLILTILIEWNNSMETVRSLTIDKTLESLEFDTTANRDSLEQDTASNSDSFEIVTAPTSDSIGTGGVHNNERRTDSVSKSRTFESEKQETSFDFEQKSEQKNVSKSSDFAANQPEYSFDFEKRASVFRNADVKTTKTTTKTPKNSGEKRSLPKKDIKKQPEVFYITDDDLESACKIPNIPREYYEVDSVAQNQNSSIPDTPIVADRESIDTSSMNQELSTEVTRDDDEPADDRKTNNETS
ncbi:hypothetical protein KUTeg_009622 [Tegillarca granosa]|uniref:Uncharacterized protein n=1 Tax=Tegillarca granosa TaxID=220873 RepID=A0ABQ9F4E7_TEGGR|nr:hypothetical protein KUTeg_009622 [Tegillarca granosa]